MSHPVTFTSLFPTSGSFRVTPCNLAPKLKVTKCDTQLHISGSIDRKAGANDDGQGASELAYSRAITRFRCSSMAHRASGPTKTVDSRSSTIAGPSTVDPGSRL